ncbi:multinuclear nonheme iron-dependent oxidase [Comamonas sp. MYb69]|uniref:multinuclear nonheme iron-dependent oxidase n=1 Tax=Comamonas sp. MYb69 TaxID=1848650 RepID=UPI0030A8FE88
MIGLGFRREMLDWDMSAVHADFFEVAPENWVRRDLAPLQALIDSGRPVHLHGVALNLGGAAPLDRSFLRDLRQLIDDLDTPLYSDHLAASGDSFQLYDLFAVPFTELHARRVADRIRAVQDALGMRISVENTTWYTNVGAMPEADFLGMVLDLADCHLLLDLNNLSVNHKNHGGPSPSDFVQGLDMGRVSYMHVAGHEFDARFDLFMDTHSQPVEAHTQQLARSLAERHGTPVLLEWDNDVPGMEVINQELACLRTSTTM